MFFMVLTSETSCVQQIIIFILVKSPEVLLYFFHLHNIFYILFLIPSSFVSFLTWTLTKFDDCTVKINNFRITTIYFKLRVYQILSYLRYIIPMRLRTCQYDHADLTKALLNYFLHSLDSISTIFWIAINMEVTIHIGLYKVQ